MLILLLAFGALVGIRHFRKVAVAHESPTSVFHDDRVVELANAAEVGDVETIDRLARAGVDVNAMGRGRATPLFRAFFAKNRDGYQELMKHGADPNAITRIIHHAEVASTISSYNCREKLQFRSPKLLHPKVKRVGRVQSGTSPEEMRHIVVLA